MLTYIIGALILATSLYAAWRLWSEVGERKVVQNPTLSEARARSAYNPRGECAGREI